MVEPTPNLYIARGATHRKGFFNVSPREIADRSDIAKVIQGVAYSFSGFGTIFNPYKIDNNPLVNSRKPSVKRQR